MSTFKVKGQLAFACDGCPETIEPESQSFSEGWAEAKEKGWVCFSKRGGGFEHYCPSCKEDLG